MHITHVFILVLYARVYWPRVRVMIFISWKVAKFEVMSLVGDLRRKSGIYVVFILI